MGREERERCPAGADPTRRRRKEGPILIRDFDISIRFFPSLLSHLFRLFCEFRKLEFLVTVVRTSLVFDPLFFTPGPDQSRRRFFFHCTIFFHLRNCSVSSSLTFLWGCVVSSPLRLQKVLMLFFHFFFFPLLSSPLFLPLWHHHQPSTVSSFFPFRVPCVPFSWN